jgi:hypothetical protein
LKTTALAPIDKENPLVFFFKKPKIWEESGISFKKIDTFEN